MLLRSFVVMIRFLVLVRISVLERLSRSRVFYRENHELGLNLGMLVCRSAVLVLCSAVFKWSVGDWQFFFSRWLVD